MTDIVIVAAVRTAIGKFGGALAKAPAPELGATVIKALLARAHLIAGPEDTEIVLGHVANSTIGNAEETGDWMRAEGLHSLRLVTANYHMPRSLLEFRHAMPDIAIVPNPVFPADSPDSWRDWPEVARAVALEYEKYLLAWLSLALVADGDGR